MAQQRQDDHQAEGDRPVPEMQRLPEDLLQEVREHLGQDAVQACAPIDLDDHGRYVDGFLLLAADRLGSAVREDGRWRWDWLPTADLGEACIVEGLGLSLLRLLRQGRTVAEFRYSMRHAKSVARLHRQLERRINGEAAAEAEAPEPTREDEKKHRCEKCSRPIPAWADFCPACMSRRKILWRLLDFVGEHKLRAVVGATLAIVISVVSLVQPWLTKPMLDEGLGGRKGADPNWPLFLTYVGVLSALIAVTSIGRGVQGWLMAGLGSRVARSVRDRVYTHIHRLSLSFFSKKQTGGLVTRVTTDSDRLWDFVAFTAVEMSVSVLTIVGVGVAMFLMNWKLACFVLLPVPLMIFAMVLFHNRLHLTFRRIMHRWSQMTAVVADALPGVRVIKAFGQERREVKRFDDKNEQVFEEELSAIRTFSAFGPAMTLCSQLGVLIIWLLGGWWVVRDYYLPAADAAGAMTVGKLMAFIGYMFMFYRPIHMLAHMDRALNRAATSAQRIFEILDTPPAIFSKAAAQPASGVRGKVELRDVSFSYDGVRKVLKDVDLVIQPGEMIGLAGPSGGGKTTMVNLICRFYDVLTGQILIDDVDVRDYDLEQLRTRIGVVLQEPFLFHGTVAENIAYGKPGATLKQIIAAAKAANAHDFIVGFPDGYDILVGERGQSLSGGERQRISIARAILNDPIILILDEATSSVDTETEKLIQEALDRLVADRTTIAIAHRLSTLRKADRLVILEKGVVIEEGAHRELAAKEGGLYAKLLRMQTEMQSVMAV